MSQQEITGAAVAQIVRDVFVTQLQDFTQRRDLAVRPAAFSDSFFNPWVALILVSGPHVKVTFKVFFKSKVVQALLAPMLGVRREEVPAEHAIDFAREWCNLVAGGLKTRLGAVGLKTGISLPVVIRAFDEIYFNAGPVLEAAHYWNVTLGEGESLLASSYIELSEIADGPTA